MSKKVMNKASESKFKVYCEQRIDQLMEQVAGLHAAVISTADGFEIASKVYNTAQTQRLAAMAGSISALGQVVGHESQLGASKSILIQADKGHLAVLHINAKSAPLTLSLIAGPDAVIGQVLLSARQMARDLEVLA